jgi:hypothetical protein
LNNLYKLLAMGASLCSYLAQRQQQIRRNVGKVVLPEPLVRLLFLVAQWQARAGAFVAHTALTTRRAQAAVIDLDVLVNIVVATRVWIETAEAALMATGVHHSGLPGHGVAVDVANTFKKIQYQNVTSDV